MNGFIETVYAPPDRNEAGDTIMEIPLTIGVAGAVLAPTLAAVGSIAALITKC